MIGTRKALSRRTMLKGFGAALSLPFLDAMTPAFAAKQGELPVRLAWFYVPNGIDMRHWTPAEEGALDTLPRVRELLLELCDPARARVLVRRLTQKRVGGGAVGGGGPPLDALVAQRLLEVAQGFVRRQLDDEVGIRVASGGEGCTYLELRMKLLEFLDATPSSLTATDVEDFFRPRIGTWDLDFETQTMRIVLRTQEPAPRQKRALAI